ATPTASALTFEGASERAGGERTRRQSVPLGGTAAGGGDPVSLLVQKFGGTSVADTDRMKAVADHVVRTRRQGHDVVVVVSAMGKSTDDLLRLAADVAPDAPGRELDMLLTAGERISMALLCM